MLLYGKISSSCHLQIHSLRYCKYIKSSKNTITKNKKMENKLKNVFAKSLHLIFLSPWHLLHMAMLMWKQSLLPINLFNFAVAVVQSLSLGQLFVTPRTAAHQAPQSSIICCSLLKFMSIKSVMLSNHVILCHPSPPAFNLSQHQSLFQ